MAKTPQLCRQLVTNPIVLRHRGWHHRVIQRVQAEGDVDVRGAARLRQCPEADWGVERACWQGCLRDGGQPYGHLTCVGGGMLIVRGKGAGCSGQSTEAGQRRD